MFKIKNGNEFKFIGRFDGQDFLFPPGEIVACSDEAAKHIFGIGDQNKAPYLARHGWATVTGGLAQGMAILDNFAFEYIVPQMDVPFALIEHGPAPVTQEAGDDAGGTDGPSEESPAVRSPKRGRPPLDRLHRAVA